MSLDLRLKARDIALSETGVTDPALYTLQHTGKYEPELLRLIASHLDYVRTIEKKIPEWFKNGKTLPFTGLNLEQSSSELTARYKAGRVAGDRALDLSGGLGVDSYFLAQKFNHFVHNEPAPGLSEVVQHNFGVLNVTGVTFTNFPAEDYPWPSTPYQWVYLDPSRRDTTHRKLVLPEDCQPDLPALRTRILEHTEAIMVKYSPMLDIRLALERLKTVHEVWILAERNEVKELVFILRKTAVSQPEIRCVNLASGQPEFVFTYEEEKNVLPRYSTPLEYLYEPNTSLLKAGAFKCGASRFGLSKLAPNSHLYTHTDLLPHFPGRILRISEVTSFDAKRLNEMVPTRQANIITRNFPLKPEQIKKKLGWKDGGSTYLYLTEDVHRKKLAIVARKWETGGE